MSKEIKTQKALEHLQKATKKLSENIEEISKTVGEEIELIASQLSMLESHSTTLKTKDFKYPIGNKVAFPNTEDDPIGLFERIIDEKDFLPISFLERGVQIQRSIARVVLTQADFGLPPGTGLATGFMVSPSLFLTNNHVIPDKEFAKKIRIQFNFQSDLDGNEQPTESFFPDTNDVFKTNQALDYTLIRLRPNQLVTDITKSVMAGNRWGFIQLNDNPIFRDQQHCNIIQHPSGRKKEVSLQDNEIYQLFENVVRYTADTEPGSSGSPVFDNVWQLLALHHAGGERDANGKWLNNQGIRIDKIVEDLRQHFTSISQENVLTELGI